MQMLYDAMFENLLTGLPIVNSLVCRLECCNDLLANRVRRLLRHQMRPYTQK